MIVIYTVCKDSEEASMISKALVKNKLAVCTNHWPINSCYEWEGKLEEGREEAMIIKTAEEKEGDVYEQIQELHSYKTPAILTLSVSNADKDYLDWISKF